MTHQGGIETGTLTYDLDDWTRLARTYLPGQLAFGLSGGESIRRMLLHYGVHEASAKLAWDTALAELREVRKKFRP
jgi:hypothetical protein